MIDQAAKGEPFIIAKAGKPLVKVIALNAPEPSQCKRLGFMAGQIVVPDDFDRMGEREIEEIFGAKLLIDTHLLLWVDEPERLSAEARALMKDAGNDLFFSVASIWKLPSRVDWTRGFTGRAQTVTARLAGQ